MKKETTGREPSLILALHARYEQAWAEYNRIDAAQPPEPASPQASPEKWGLYHRLGDAMTENAREVDLVRALILYQVPIDDEELTVLAYHARSLHDLGDHGEAEKLALWHGLTSIFDYLVSEGRADPDTLGAQFAAEAKLAGEKVRLRRACPVPELTLMGEKA